MAGLLVVCGSVAVLSATNATSGPGTHDYHWFDSVAPATAAVLSTAAGAWQLFADATNATSGPGTHDHHWFESVAPATAAVSSAAKSSPTDEG